MFDLNCMIQVVSLARVLRLTTVRGYIRGPNIMNSCVYDVTSGATFYCHNYRCSKTQYDVKYLGRPLYAHMKTVMLPSDHAGRCACIGMRIAKLNY